MAGLNSGDAQEGLFESGGVDHEWAIYSSADE
jgi:hypothetical protein